MKQETTDFTPKSTGTPQSRRREQKRANKKAKKDHSVHRNTKGGQSKPR